MKQQTVIPDAIRFAPLHAAWMADSKGGGSWCVMTRRDDTPGSLNNFSVAECQHKADATFFASSPDLLRQRDKLREALADINAITSFIEAHPADMVKSSGTKITTIARAILAETEAA